MNGTELHSLESKVDTLIKSFQQISIENSSLRKKVVTLGHERIASSGRKKRATELLRKIIIQLQDEISWQIQK